MIAIKESLVPEFVVEVGEEEGVVEESIDSGLMVLLGEGSDFLVVVDLARDMLTMEKTDENSRFTVERLLSSED